MVIIEFSKMYAVFYTESTISMKPLRIITDFTHFLSDFNLRKSPNDKSHPPLTLADV